MNSYAIMHVLDSSYAFPVSENVICVRLRTAKNDVKSVWVLYESKYRIAKKHKKAKMVRTLSGSEFDYYSIYLTLEDTRFAYVFYIYDGKEYKYFSEDGLTDTYDFSQGYYNFFQFADIHPADIHRMVPWMADACFYQIFPERFRIGNTKKDMSYIDLKWGDKPNPRSFAGGDLKGITQKLDYIKGLGCNALYLTPIFESPSNHKYDIIDYMKVDEHFGTADDLRELVKKAHKKGIRVILDAVFNHCSDKSAYFRDVCKKGRKSPYYEQFMIHGDKVSLNPRNYEVFADCVEMPRWNSSNRAAQEFLISVAVHYIKEFDIDGWRLDVSDEVSHDFWRRFREAVKSAKPDAVIIGENWHDASSYLRGDQYDGIMNYAFTKACLDYFAAGKYDAKQAAERLNDVLARNTDTVNDMMLNLLDCHDTVRFLTGVKEDRDALNAALCLLYLFPGAPSVFYGTEVYTTGQHDPDCRRCMDWSKAGTEAAEPVTGLIRTLADIRKKYRLTSSGTRIGASDDGRLLCLERTGEDYRILLYINRTDKTGKQGRISVQAGKYTLIVNSERVKI